jgi:hypothetical protein
MLPVPALEYARLLAVALRKAFLSIESSACGVYPTATARPWRGHPNHSRTSGRRLVAGPHLTTRRSRCVIATSPDHAT